MIKYTKKDGVMMNLPKAGTKLPDNIQLTHRIFLSENIAVYDGFDLIDKAKFKVVFTNLPELIERLNFYHLIRDECPKLQSVPKTGYLDNKDLFFACIQQLPENWISLRQGKTFKSSKALSFFVDLCQIIEQIHQKGFVLLELTPDLIQVDKNCDSVKTILYPTNLLSFPMDFNFVLYSSNSTTGISEVFFSPSPLLKSKDVRHLLKKYANQNSEWTKTFALINPFIGPECLTQSSGKTSDIYSLGRILQWLFSENTVLLKQDLLSEIVDLSQLDLLHSSFASEVKLIKTLEYIYFLKLLDEPKTSYLGIPNDLAAIISKATSPNPEERYQTVRDLLEDIKNLPRHTLNIIVKEKTDAKGGGAKKLRNIKLAVELGGREKIIGFTDRNGVFEINNLIAESCSITATGNNSYLSSNIINLTIPHKDNHIVIELTRVPLSERLARVWFEFKSAWYRRKK